MYQVLWQFSLVALFIETSTTKRVFLWSRSHRDLQFFCKFGMTFTWTKNVQKSSYHDRHFPVIVENELRKATCTPYHAPQSRQQNSAVCTDLLTFFPLLTQNASSCKDNEDLTRTVAYLPQRNVLQEDLTVEEHMHVAAVLRGSSSSGSVEHTVQGLKWMRGFCCCCCYCCCWWRWYCCCCF